MSSDPTAVIKLADVSKAYPTWAGRGRRCAMCSRGASRSATAMGSAMVAARVTLWVGAGESVGLIGSNGAGKSTMLRVASGLTRPSEGSVTIPAARPRC